LPLYDQLLALQPHAVVAVNRAVAVAELDGYQPFHATQADLLRRARRTADIARCRRMPSEVVGLRSVWSASGGHEPVSSSTPMSSMEPSSIRSP